jgi:hypothetical protein
MDFIVYLFACLEDELKKNARSFQVILSSGEACGDGVNTSRAMTFFDR